MLLIIPAEESIAGNVEEFYRERKAVRNAYDVDEVTKQTKEYFKRCIDKLPSKIVDGEEVWTGIDAIDEILKHNEAITKILKGGLNEEEQKQ